jgi:synaptojanin
MLISRRRHARGGARFFCRGIDDEANVGNFVESELVVVYQERIYSFVQVRGSIPLFWDQKQKGLQTIIKIKRNETMTYNVFKRHFSKLIKDYQQTCIINLISKVKPEEDILSKSYTKLLDAC